MHFGFSFVGLMFLVMLFVPNMFWTKNKPANYDRYAKNENRILLIFERTGEISVSCLLLIFSDFNPKGVSPWEIWLALAFVCMIIYEFYWIGYFKSDKEMRDFYRGFLGIPVAGATLPVLAVLFISAYGKNPFLLLADIILAVGHIGIHLMHKKEVTSHL